ncbi:MAG: sulfur transferase domain-containing protein [bacterium]|nr:sulfur transferase domain-containing protein [bacterium]
MNLSFRSCGGLWDSVFLFVLLCIFGSGHPRLGAQENQSEESLPRRITCQHLPNAIQLTPGLISGGLPAGDEAFAELATLGIRTIISVDAAPPDSQAARRHGLRYVHLPHGYDGVSAEQGQALAKALLELEGPVYIHCHHGLHRSPAAASVAGVTAGWIQVDKATKILEFAGTATKYKGLYASARKARQVPAEQLHRLDVRFQEKVSVSLMAEAMVRIDEHLQLLKAVDGEASHKLKDSQAEDPAHAALLLMEEFRELLRTDETLLRSVDFQDRMRRSWQDSQRLEGLLRVRSGKDPSWKPAFSKLLQRISDDCSSCHALYRDVPVTDDGSDF